MSNSDRELISRLIVQIRSAEDPDSISPEMVGRVFQYLAGAQEELAENLNGSKKDITDLEDVIKGKGGVSYQQLLLDFKRLEKDLANCVKPGQNGKISESLLPIMNVVRFFNGIVSVNANEVKSNSASGSEVDSICFNTKTNRFVFAVDQEDEEEIDNIITTYYANWSNSGTYGEFAGGIKPTYQCVYFNLADKILYVWSGSTLIPVADLESIRNDIRDLGEDIGDLRHFEEIAGTRLNNLEAKLGGESSYTLSGVAELAERIDTDLVDAREDICLLDIQNLKEHRAIRYDIRALRREDNAIRGDIRKLGICMSVFSDGAWNGFAVWNGGDIWRGEPSPCVKVSDIDFMTESDVINMIDEMELPLNEIMGIAPMVEEGKEADQ